MTPEDEEKWAQRVKPDPPPAPDLLSEPVPLWIWWYIGAWVVGVPTFIGAWAWCIYTYGFMIGVGLGWFPSLITAVVVGALWPLWLILVVWLWMHLGSPGAGEIWEALRGLLL